MKRRDIVIGLIIFVVIAAVVLWSRKPRVTPVESPLPSPQTKVEEKFNYEIPEDANKVDLKNVAGGEGQGIATRVYRNNRFELVILADLEDPQKGEFYEGWLVKGKEGETDFGYLKLGSLRMAKGGYLLEFDADKDYSAYNQLWVTLETKADNKPEKHILEGSF